MTGWAAHELGHAIHWVARHPDQVPYVDVERVGSEARVEPHIICEVSELGMTPLINFVAGSMGERVHAGERDCIKNLIQCEGNWLKALFDTPHHSPHDQQCFQMILSGTPSLPVEEFTKELFTAERLIERYLPLVDVNAFQNQLERDGRFRFGVHNLKRTLH